MSDKLRPLGALYLKNSPVMMLEVWNSKTIIWKSSLSKNCFEHRMRKKANMMVDVREKNIKKLALKKLLKSWKFYKKLKLSW